MIDRVKLIVGMISASVELFDAAGHRLIRKLGETDYESPVMDFAHTDYYNDEMGGPLKRKFLSFRKLIHPEGAADIKILTNGMEKVFSKAGARRVNIDPGYVDLSKLVLLTTKDYTHRIYLRKGIYAEVTLYFKNGGFNPWEWTYPDYRSALYIGIFNEIRRLYKDQIGLRRIPSPREAGRGTG